MNYVGLLLLELFVLYDISSLRGKAHPKPFPTVQGKRGGQGTSFKHFWLSFYQYNIDFGFLIRKLRNYINLVNK